MSLLTLCTHTDAARSIPAHTGSASGSAAYLRAHAAAFSTHGADPLDGKTLLPGALEEWNTEALPPGINQQTLCVFARLNTLSEDVLKLSYLLFFSVISIRRARHSLPGPISFPNHRLTVFMGHRHQAHFDYIGSRLIQTLSQPSSSSPTSTSAPPRPHPCLINSIYLFASHFSRSATIAQYDALFLARARLGMQAAIAAEDRLLDVIQAGCLVSLYLYFKSRVLEGYMLGGAVSRLAISVGLHQIESPFLRNGLSAVGSGHRDKDGKDRGKEEEEPPKLLVENPVGMTLPEPKSLAELGDRIHTFWQVRDYCYFNFPYLTIPRTLFSTRFFWNIKC